MIDRDFIRSEFPRSAEWAYLATAANGILPERSRRHLERYFAEDHYLELGSHYRMFDDLAAIRERAARCFGGASRNWALLPNTSYGISTVAGAVPWRDGDNVVLADCEFPANVMPWKHLAPLGVSINWAACPDLRARAERLIDACDARTRVLAVAGVQFLNGYLPDLVSLADFCRERGIWLCVDGIQGLGNRHWDLPAMGIDFLAAGGQKWLCAPRGTGLLYCSDRAMDALDAGELRAAQLGWLNTERWKFTALLDYDLPLTRDARVLEIGTYAFHDLLCLGHSLELVEELGPATIAAHCDGLLQGLLDGLEARGLSGPKGPYATAAAADEPARRSQTTAIACPDPIALWRRLAEAKIAVNPREGGVRVAFHYYSLAEDLERLLDALSAG